MPNIPSAAPAPLRIHYLTDPDPAALPENLLAALVFHAPMTMGPPRPEAEASAHHQIQVALEPIPGPILIECWCTESPAIQGQHGDIRFSMTPDYLFASTSVAEAEHQGLAGAAQAAYARLLDFQATQAHSHVWRIWNFMDAINEGLDDAERYRQFCIGRAEAIAGRMAGYPAATAIGRRDGDRTLQVFWLATRQPSQAIENPRQTSAFHYPRRYGPVSPGFVRAARLGAQTLISGTASIVGHESVHPEDVDRQFDEVQRNLEALSLAITASNLQSDELDGVIDVRQRFRDLRAYVRNPRDAVALLDRVRAAGYPHAAPAVLIGDICRQELLVEVEATFG